MTQKRSTNPAPAKHIPQRTCVACGGVRPKRELVRLVRVSGGGVEVDPAGRKAGAVPTCVRRRIAGRPGLKKDGWSTSCVPHLPRIIGNSLLNTKKSWDKERFIG